MMEPTLLILAAGLGSRYGRLKQLDGMGPNEEALFEYSVYDAIQCGFGKVVFVINRQIEKQFRDFIRGKFPEHIGIDFVFQEKESHIGGNQVSAERKKPWGTGHAVLVARDSIQGPFLMINADDFYGRESYKLAAEAFKRGQDFFIIGYEIGKTLSEHGTVNRAELKTDDSGRLFEIEERLGIRKEKETLFYNEKGKSKKLSGPGVLISMNIMGFPEWIFPQIEKRFNSFIREYAQDPTAEFLIPAIINELIREQDARAMVIKTAAEWFGVTFPEDKARVRERIRQLIAQGEYPYHLWGKW